MPEARAIDTTLKPPEPEPERLTWRVSCDPDGIRDIAGVAGNDLWAIEGDRNLLHFDGHRWSVSHRSPIPLAALFATANDDIWAVGVGAALHYDGTRWKRIETDPRVSLAAVWAAARDDVWAVGSNGTPQIWHFDGSRFQLNRSMRFDTTAPRDIWGTSADDVWAVGGHTVAHFDGSAWSVVPLPPTVFKNGDIGFNGIWGSARDDYWLVGTMSSWTYDRQEHGRAVTFHFDGRQWKQSPLPYRNIDYQLVEKVRGFGRNLVWLVGHGFRFRYDGQHWRSFGGKPVSKLASSVWVGGRNDVWFGRESIVHWDGSWREEANPAPLSCGAEPEGRLTGIWGNSANNVWACASNVKEHSKLLHYDGENWTPGAGKFDHSPDVGFEAIQGTPSGDFWVVGRNTRIGGDGLRSVTGIAQYRGLHGWDEKQDLWMGSLHALFAESGDEAYAVGAGGLVLHLDRQRTQVELAGVPEVEGVTLEQVARGAPNLTSEDLYAVWSSPERDVWAAGNNGVLLRRTNGTWSTVSSSTQNHLRGLWGANKNDVWAVGAAGTLLHFDGGAWIKIESKVPWNLRAIWGSAANDIWAVGDFGTIIHFTGHAWHSVTNDDSNHLIGIAGTSPDDIWAIGTQVILHATPMNRSTGQ